MITKLYVSNYRSIGQGLELELGGLTALVGPNGAGKSNVADVLRFLSDCVNTSLSHAVAVRQGFRALGRWSAGRPYDVEVGVELTNDHGSGRWKFTLAAGSEEDGFRVKRESAFFDNQSIQQPGYDPEKYAEQFQKLYAQGNIPYFEREDSRWRGSTQYSPVSVSSTNLALPLFSEGPLAILANELRRLAIYSLFPNRLREPQNPNPVKPMTGSGDNWASTLKALNKQTWGSELLAGLGHIVGDIDDYRVAQAGGFLIPEFRHRTEAAEGRERWHGAAQESDGTLRVAAILTALFQEPALSLIGFEEPELAVHPGAIPVLFDFLDEARARSQILLTTHSPDLLDLIPVDDLRVVERREGATFVSRVDERQRDLVRRRLMSTSDLLHAEGLRPEGARDDG